MPRFGWSRTSAADQAEHADRPASSVRVGSCISRERAGEEVGHEEQERELGELRRLDLERPDAEPAGGAVDLDADARHEHDAPAGAPSRRARRGTSWRTEPAVDAQRTRTGRPMPSTAQIAWRAK